MIIDDMTRETWTVHSTGTTDSDSSKTDTDINMIDENLIYTLQICNFLDYVKDQCGSFQGLLLYVDHYTCIRN